MPASRPVSLLIFLAIVGFVLACNSDYTIRRRGYYNIDFPKHQYQQYNIPDVPYSFEYPTYSRIVQDTSFFEDKPENPYWINIEFPSFNGKIYLSYKQISGRQSFDKLVDDAFKLTYKHTAKATDIKDSLMLTPEGISGIFFKVGGNAATGRQFFLTDSVRNFVRGALYFDATPNADSLNIINDFLEVDMRHLINTFKWKP